MNHPAYCHALRVSGIYSPWCAGQRTCHCAPYCKLWVSPWAWGNDPMCCHCATGRTLVAQGTFVEPMASTAPAGEGVDVATGGPLRRPSYCETLPPGIAPPWCEGDHQCGCSSYCEASVAPVRWGVDPNCCGCTTNSTLSVPGAVDPSPANSTYEPMDHPQYCNALRPDAPVPLWCQGNRTCSCQPYCSAFVSPAAWGWDPNCCGCSAP